MTDPALFIVCNANQKFVAAHYASDVGDVLGAAPEWSALHRRQIGANSWLAYRPEGHLALQVFRYRPRDLRPATMPKEKA